MIHALGCDSGICVTWLIHMCAMTHSMAVLCVEDYIEQYSPYSLYNRVGRVLLQLFAAMTQSMAVLFIE